MQLEAKRFSGADWASELRNILLVGVGGIGSWTALSLSRIGHSLILVDGDRVDRTNVTGGQLYGHQHTDQHKVDATQRVCREFGCSNDILPIERNFVREDADGHHIIITGLDSMKPRREVYEAWRANLNSTNRQEAILIDGRLTMEMFEVFTLVGTDTARMAEYEKDWLFSDEQSQELDCTTKQSSFGAMGIGAHITALLCNHLTNMKLGMNFREVPFYQRMYYPLMCLTSIVPVAQEEEKIEIKVEEPQKQEVCESQALLV